MRPALERHDALVRGAIEAHGGYVFSTGGDGFAAAFARAGDAVAAAIDGQAGLLAYSWPKENVIRVRMGMHTGEAEQRGGDYFGPALNRAARVMALGHGGQVLCSSVTGALIEGVEIVDLGEHRLRDLSGPQHVLQVGRGAFPPLRSLDALPGNLPQIVSSFVGREAELAAVAEAVRATRLVTVTGVGGVGKTRLALQVAADVITGFSGGAWLCELAAAATDDELWHVVAIALGVVQRPQMTMVESIVDLLRPRRMLVVLDNCEHLLDEAGELVEAVLAGAPEVHVLATSREGLGIAGEQVWPLRSLRLGTPDEGNSEAVELFTARARAADPAFALDATNLPAVAEVCRRLDGIPLAIELAAARVPTMSAAEIAGHLDERFRLLTGGRRRGVERHQTLRSAIAWSYSLLSPAERVVFDRLGAFPSSFDEAAAVAVVSGDGVERWDVIDALAGLAAKSMIGAERSDGSTRYQLLETLRHFAREQLESRSETDAGRRRHAVHYARVAAEIGAGLMSRDELQWRRRLFAELDNLRAAAAWAFETAEVDDVRLGVGVIGSLLVYAGMSPAFGVQAWAAAALPRLDDLAGDDRAVVLGAAAADGYWRGDIEAAKAFASRAIAEVTTVSAALAVAYMQLGLTTAVSGDPAGAVAVLVDGRARLAASGLTPDEVAVFVDAGLGWVAYDAGDLDLARTVATGALAVARRSGVPAVMAASMALMARTLPDDRADEALALAIESMRIVDEGAGGESSYGAAAQTAAMLLASHADSPGAARALHRAVSYSAARGELVTNASNIGIAVFVLAGGGDLAGAATLGGATEGPELARRFLSPDHRRRYDEALSDVAHALGPGEYGEARERGTTMTYDEIIEFTLDHLARLSASK
jgi:predicted ATPase